MAVNEVLSAARLIRPTRQRGFCLAGRGWNAGTADHPDRAESATGDLIVGVAAANQSASPGVLFRVRAELGSERDSDRRAPVETRGLRALSCGCLRPGLRKQITEG
jgi:hypothetical protein